MKKILIILFVLLSSFAVFAETSSFSDVKPEDWFYDTVSTFNVAGIISGYEDGTFRPENKISVEEFITITVKVSGLEEADVIKKTWSDGFVERAKIMTWVQEGEFLDFTRRITRGEMARIVLRAADITVPDDYLSYAPMISDFKTMDQYWQNIALRVFSVGLISGYPDGRFDLNGQATRAEASAVLYKIYDPSVIKAPEIEVDVFTLRRQDIQKKWDLLKPTHTGDYFDIEPSATLPYVAGELKTTYLDDGVNTLNFMRLLAYLPGDTYYSDSANLLAQHGAVLNAASEFSHTPAQPTDMLDAFYDKGYNATSSGNLAAGIKSLSNAVKRLFDDEDASNISRIGHRRWFLLPKLYEVGFGYLEQSVDWLFYSVVKVFDGLATKEFGYDSVKWPSETAFPLQYFDLSTPWSVTLNPEVYDNTKIDDIKVTLFNKTSNKTYTFDKTNKDLEGHYFNVETTGYGIPFCIIFRPGYENETPIMDNDVFQVTIENIYKKDGSIITMSYETQFFNLK